MFRLVKTATQTLPKRTINLQHNFMGKYSDPKYLNHKDTTGLTGLPVEPEASRIYPILIDRTLELLETKYPEDSVYAKTMIDFYQDRKALFDGAESIADFEEKVGSTVEMQMFAVRNELNLAESLHLDEVWEALEEEAPAGQWVWP